MPYKTDQTKRYLSPGGLQLLLEVDNDEVDGRIDEAVPQRVCRRDLSRFQFRYLLRNKMKT